MCARTRKKMKKIPEKRMTRVYRKTSILNRKGERVLCLM